MCKTWHIAFFMLIGSTSFAQSDYNTRFQNAFNTVQQKNFAKAIEEFKAINNDFPAQSNVHVQTSWCYLMQGNLNQAIAFAENAIFLDQFNVSAWAIYSYALFAQGKEEEGFNALNIGLWLLPDDNSFQYFTKDFDEVIAAGYYAAVFRKVKQQSAQMANARDRSFMTINGLIGAAYQLATTGKMNDAVRNCEKAVNTPLPESYKPFKGFVALLAGRMLVFSQHPAEASPFLETALSEFSKYSFANTMSRATTITALANSYSLKFDNQRAFDLMSANVNSIMTLPSIAEIEKARFLNVFCNVSSLLTKGSFIRPYAEALVKCTNLGFEEPALIANGYNHLGGVYQGGKTAQDLEMAGAYYKKAYDISENAGLTQLSNNIMNNYALFLQKSGKANEALMIYYSDTQARLKRGDFLGAETNYNNMGAIYLRANQYKNAAEMFAESIKIIEKYRNQFKGEEKLNFMARGISSYQFMVMALAKLQDSNALFEAQNKERGRVLSEMLGNGSFNKSMSLAEFQKMLKSDETAIMYTSMEPGNVIIHVINKTSTYATANEQFDLFVKLKKRFLDRMQKFSSKAGYKPVSAEIEGDVAHELNQGDMDNFMQLTRELLQTNIPERLPFLKQFTDAYYQFLISPIENKITGKKLILFPDGLLNFLPFEALTDPNGKYVVEKYDVRYSQSAEVKRLIESRNYARQPKAMLAMGGAQFEEMNEKAEPIKSTDQLFELQTLAAQNAESGKSQRAIYAALGFEKMNYLAGSLAEAKKLQEMFGTAADVYTGNQMTENFVKELSSSGQLQNYRIVHLATHGFALPQIPQLSGVAMSIYRNAQGNEDGYLTAPEISKLNMHADLAVLSACETGLGKIYGGEGVNGLTQALLVGGANRAIVSLWPVSDEGTMYFMTGLYDLTEKQGKSFDEAVNMMKRKFITGEFGEQFKLPSIWAPFVHYGK